MMPVPHVLLIAVGPVQPFIAAARKIRDLWAGSHLLSLMSKRVAEVLNEECDLVFPSPLRLPSDLEPESELGVANKILCVTAAGADPATLVARVKDALDAQRRFFYRNVMDALAAHPDCLDRFVDRRRFEAQGEDYGELYAVWVPLGGDYKAACARVERLLAARKMLRDFRAPRWSVGNGSSRISVRKNALDGARESVLTNVTSSSGLVGNHIIRINEDLDALGLVKRWHGLHSPAARGIAFDTLSDIALVPFLEGIESSGDKLASDALRSARNAISSLGAAKREKNALLYENRLASWLKEGPRGLTPSAITAAQRGLRTLYKSAGGEPPGYACVLHGDGDNMGRAIDRLAEQTHHKLFSRALAGFTEGVRAVVDRHGGSLVYSGGDDVLAFLPMHTALACALEVRMSFRFAMDVLAEEIHENDPDAATAFLAAKPAFSAGLAIVHHLESLSGAIEISRDAEKYAKDRHGRDSLAITQVIRGRLGGDVEIGGAWDDASATSEVDQSGFVPRLMRLVDLHERDVMPGRLAHQLHHLLKTLAGRLSEHGAAQTAQNSSLLEAEARRIVLRKESTDTSGLPEDLADRLTSASVIRAFADELIVAQQIARARLLAKGKFR